MTPQLVVIVILINEVTLTCWQVEADGELLALFCGKEETDTEAVPAQQVITSPSNSLSVTFTSDFSNEERYSGFMAHYSAVGEDRPESNSAPTIFPRFLL